jgi:hypothetical protein
LERKQYQTNNQSPTAPSTAVHMRDHHHKKKKKGTSSHAKHCGPYAARRSESE